MIGFIRVLLCISVVAFVWALCKFVWMFAKPYYTRRRKEYIGIKNPTRDIMRIALLILFAVWMSRFAVGLAVDLFDINASDELGDIPCWNQFGYSLLHALMSFSMDEAFEVYRNAGEQMMEKLCHAPWLTTAFAVYSAVLNVAAPIVGGAIILDIIAELSPQVHFLFAKEFFLREKCYFTALNEQSLSLAKDIVSSKNYHNSTIIFTDAYADDEKEDSTELLLHAKALGAICLKDDLLHISIERFFKFKTTRIFLSDKKENTNLETLSKLLSRKKRSFFKNLEIYVFSSDRNNDNNKVSFLEDEVFYINNRKLAELKEQDSAGIKKITEKTDKKIQKKKTDAKKKKEEEKLEKRLLKKYPIPRVTPVNGVRNMAQNLFRDIPLFEVLCKNQKKEKDEEEKLRLTILGSGVIGTEIFLNAYWMGQMLNVVLEITIVSKESKEEFANKINFLNPEILKTIIIKNVDETKEGISDNCIDRDDVLTIKPDEKAEPYAYLTYLPENVMSSEFMLRIRDNEDKYKIIDSDYFVVALGSDEDNFTVADKLRQMIGYYHLNNDSAKDKKAIISYVIYNSELCSALNKKCRHDNVCRAQDSAEYDIYMHAFGAMDEVYSMKNVMFDGIRDDAEQIGSDYQKKNRDKNKAYSPDSIKRWKNISTQYYVYRADIARRLHLDYKMFSADCLNPSLFHTKDDSDYRKNIANAKEEYKAFINSIEKDKDDFDLLHKLAWLEHRRWNAFMRVCGFFHPDDFGKYMKLQNDLHDADEHKFLMLKLHPCLVESDIDGIHAKLDDAGKIIESEQLRTSEMTDRLDLATIKRNELKGNPQIAEHDFKRWDYPDCEAFLNE